MKPVFVSIILFLCGIVAGILLSHTCLAPEREETASSDTLSVRDTNIYNFPDMVSEIIIPEDVIVIQDSLVISEDSIVALPLQQRHYKGEDYEAWVSGYGPRLDSVRVFPETKYITEKVITEAPRKRWGIGIQVGYGMSLPDGKPTFTPYIGVGISYNLIRF